MLSAWVKTRKAWWAVAASLVLIMGTSACGDEPAPETAAPPETTLGQASTPTEQATPTTAATAGGSARCRDGKGDGKPMDLTMVALSQTGDSLSARFVMAAVPPRSGTVLWAIAASSEDGDKARQLGVKFLDGQQVAHFVFDSGSAQQENLSGRVSLQGATLTAEFPLSAVEDLGEPWNWQATVNVEGDDVDTCPEPGDDVLNPRKLKFPS